MEYSNVEKRFGTGAVDGWILFFVLHIIIISYAWNNGAIECGGAETVVMLEMVCIPGFALIHFYSEFDSFQYYMIYVLIFFAETMYYTLMEILPTKGTLGHIATKTTICNLDGTRPNALTLLARACLKTLSRYLFMIPFLTIFTTSTNQTVYDIIVGTIVIDKPPKDK